MLYFDQGKGIPQDYQEALKWFRKSAEQGFVETQFNLGVMYYNGEGVPQDYVLAHKWYNLAAFQEYKKAWNNWQFVAKDRHNRDLLAKEMTPSQIAEAQNLARNFKPKKEKP